MNAAEAERLGRLMYESTPGEPDGDDQPWERIDAVSRERWIASAKTYEHMKARPDPEEVPDCPTCHKPMRWDPDDRGTTVGGLDVVGGWVCCGGSEETCHAHRLGSRSKPASAVDWKLAKGGRSLDCGGIRLRAEGDGDVVGLLARVARLPTLERLEQKLNGGTR